jgi:predicted transposase/invertase (TIGR01784 family)
VINYCIENNILKKYLLEHGSEVINMIFGEYDREIDIAVNRREAREEGLAEGMEKGVELTARNALAKGISVQTVQEITGLSIEKITELK